MHRLCEEQVVCVYAQTSTHKLETVYYSQNFLAGG